MKKGFYFLVLIGFGLHLIFTVSCNKTPTYEELKAAERKLINRIIALKNIEVLREYPANGIFGENQFVELPSGIYLNVVDSGNGNRAVLNETIVLVRTSGEYYEDTLISFNTFTHLSYPFEFKFGQAIGVVNEHLYALDDYYILFGIGLESILNYVGDSAVVKLIVPGYSEIKIGNNPYGAGSTFQSGSGSRFIPIYFDRVRYIFY